MHNIVNKKFPILVFDSIKKVISMKKLKKQNNKNSIYYHQRKLEDSKINFDKMDAKKLDCFVRALNNPYPNAYFYLKDKIVKVQKIKPKKINLKPGKIKFLNGNFYVGCKKNAVRLVNYKIVKTL